MSDRPVLGQCKGCERLVYWVKAMKKGRRVPKWMPLDADPDTGRPRIVAGGNVQLDHMEAEFLSTEHTMIVRVLGAASTPDPNRETWVTHFSTCPQADYFRNLHAAA